MTIKTSSKTPRSGPEREQLRNKGQFWTPDWVADFMCAYVLQNRPKRLLDPALGNGAFFRAAKRYAMIHDFPIDLFGCDNDFAVIDKAHKAGLDDNDLRNVDIRDFVLDPPSDKFPAIIANPPYIRHHRLSTTQKERLKLFALTETGCRIDGRAGLHVYFLIRTLQTLSPEGRLAFIVSADICEGVFANALWEWICAHFRIDAVITFTRETAPFPDVDTNAIVFFIRKSKPGNEYLWAKCLEACPLTMHSFSHGKLTQSASQIEIHSRTITESLETGFSRNPDRNKNDRFTLGDFATVMRGIVTGDNEFFFLTSKRCRELDIPSHLLVRALGRTRDVQGDCFDENDLQRLDASGRPSYLLNLNGYRYEDLPEPVKRYLTEGEARGISEKTLIKTRTPWYKMETRKTPPIMFAYLGRRNARFIRNYAGVAPLTCLLCIYPRFESSDFLERLWKVLSHERTIANLAKVGKTYGGGAIKVEPRALERLPLPDELVQNEGLDKLLPPKQTSLFDDI